MEVTATKGLSSIPQKHTSSVLKDKDIDFVGDTQTCYTLSARVAVIAGVEIGVGVCKAGKLFWPRIVLEGGVGEVGAKLSARKEMTALSSDEKPFLRLCKGAVQTFSTGSVGTFLLNARTIRSHSIQRNEIDLGFWGKGETIFHKDEIYIDIVAFALSGIAHGSMNVAENITSFFLGNNGPSLGERLYDWTHPTE